MDVIDIETGVGHPAGAQRLERDSLGELAVPAAAYYGIHTARALANFPITGVPIGALGDLIRAYALVKKAATHANRDLGLVTMRDAETGEQLLVDTHDAGFRARFAAAAEARETALLASLAQAGVDTLELATDDDLLDAILRFADLRRQRSRMAAGGGAPSHLGVLKTELRRAS